MILNSLRRVIIAQTQIEDIELLLKPELQRQPSVARPLATFDFGQIPIIHVADLINIWNFLGVFR
jgi:hypothetical protein